MEPLPIEFHPEAVAEASDARRWYSEIDPSLGQAFTDELDRAIARVAAAPERWARHVHGTRAFLLHRFPYLLVYRLALDRVQVIAVQHARRRPGYWKSRTSS
jgi:toxin ParE1/3/4